MAGQGERGALDFEAITARQWMFLSSIMYILSGDRIGILIVVTLSCCWHQDGSLAVLVIMFGRP